MLDGVSGLAALHAAACSRRACTEHNIGLQVSRHANDLFRSTFRQVCMLLFTIGINARFPASDRVVTPPENHRRHVLRRATPVSKAGT